MSTVMEQPKVRRLGPALAALRAATLELLTELDAEPAAGWDAEELMEFAADFEQTRNLQAGVDHHIVTIAEEIGAGPALMHKTTRSLLAQVLRISRAEAGRRVRAARAVGPRVSMLGEPLPQTRPVLAAAARSGAVTAEAVDVVARCLDTLDKVPGIDRQVVTSAEETLTDQAHLLGPEDVRKCADRLVECCDPDGKLGQDIVDAALRQIHVVKARDGSFRLNGRLTPALGVKMHAFLAPFTRPRPKDETSGLPDPRDVGQRWHDAFEDAFDLLGRSGGLPASGGTPATVIVTISKDDLINQTGLGETSDGTLLSATEVLRIAEQAEVIPAVFAKSGVLLELGRSRRIANHSQTLALIARDVGCSFPGCVHPPEFCERHHIHGWACGGRTDLANLTLLCGYHHRYFMQRGWVCRMINQLPAWIPPKWIDKEQKPIIHYRILDRNKRLRR